MSAPSLFSAAEHQLLADVTRELAKLDAYASAPLSESFTRIVQTFESLGRLELRHEDATHLVELSLGVHFDVVDPHGKAYPEVRLQYRRRSRSIVTRTARRLLGTIPAARVLVLTPSGYRLTTLRRLEAHRFELNSRPRLAIYKASSAVNLSKYLIDTFAAQLPAR